ncbi:MAG: YIP1 family protein [Actinomycetota bacterium]|nr:YIP1 family protein [Actinomycetota bacterium]
MIRNMIRAGALDIEFYNHAERATSLTRQAFVVVVVANGLAAVGSWIGYENTQDMLGGDIWNSIRGWLGIGRFPMPSEGGIFVMVGVGILLAIVGWVVWAVITSLIGTKVFKGTTDVGEMLRVLGFAQAPRVIGVIPFLGPVAAVWVLVASVVAIREGLDFSTGRAIGTAIGGWLVWIILQQVVSIFIAAIF